MATNGSLEQYGTFTYLEQRRNRKEGWLKKKSPKGFLAKAWQSRYFVLYDDLLYYYKDKPNLEGGPDSANPTGTIPMQCVTSAFVAQDKKPKGCRFDIAMDNRTFELQTDTEQECNEWVAEIGNILKSRDVDASQKIDIDQSGKFWKNPEVVRDARAKSTASGDNTLLTTNSDDEVSEVKQESAMLELDALNAKHDEAVLEVVKKLDDENFGHMYQVEDRVRRCKYIMHVIHNEDERYKWALVLFDRMAELKHPYIFQQIHRGETSDTSFAVYTDATEQSLFVHLRQQRRFPEPVATLFGAEMVLALEYLHKHGHVFRNMRAENVSVDCEGHAVISDFLMCLDEGQAPPENDTPEYYTPEFLEGRPETAAADWWRLGVLMYELLVGIPPFRKKKEENNEDLAKKIRAHRVDALRFPPFVSAHARDLIQNLLHPDPVQRLGARGSAAVKKHAFFADMNWDRLANRQVTAPEWVDENLLQNRLQQSEQMGRCDPTKTYQCIVEVCAARGLPGLQPNGEKSDPYVVVSVSGAQPTGSKRTSVKPDTVAPRWMESFSFDVRDAQGTANLEVYHQDNSAAVLIGSVNVSLREVFAARRREAWLPVIGRDAIGHGELSVVLNWLERVERVRVEPDTSTQLSFSDYFLARHSRPSLSLSAPPAHRQP